MTILIYGESTVVTALDLDLPLHVVLRYVMLDSAGHPSCLLVAEAQLAIDVEAPGVEVSIVCQASGVTVARGTTMDRQLLL